MVERKVPKEDMKSKGPQLEEEFCEPLDANWDDDLDDLMGIICPLMVATKEDSRVMKSLTIEGSLSKFKQGLIVRAKYARWYYRYGKLY